MAAEKSKTTISKKSITLAQKLIDQMLSLMGTKAKAIAQEDKENEAIRIDIDAGEETGLLIGKHGETLDAMQLLLGMMMRQKQEDWVRIILNVGDWREKQEEHLKDLAFQAADRARETGEPQNLFNLSSSQRRIIHLALGSEKDIETESAGEGKERYLIVKQKS
ncbi:MAG: KH domain-containing protein [Patescibacteria group bacterium]